MPRLTRRHLLGAVAAAGAAGLAGGFFRHNRPRGGRATHAELPPLRDPAFPNPLRVPGSDGLFGVADAAGAFTLTAKPVRQAILPGRPARLLAYEMEHHGRTLLNPVLRARTGTPLRIKFWNALEEDSIIHWHGFKVDSNNDGHPNYAVSGGAVYDYNYTVANRAGTYWYHPHPHHLTGKQVYQGLAGFFIVEDDEEIALQKALDLRLGETDIPLLLQDRTFDGNGSLAYAPDGNRRLHGHFGAEMLANLTPRPYLDVASRLYRFRLLNGSNARAYRLAFRHGEQLLDYTVVGGDGGLLDHPRTVKEAFLSPGERLDVLLDLRAARRGDAITLVSLPFDAMHVEETGGAGHAGHGAHAQPGAPGYPPDGAAFEILRILVQRQVGYDRAVPETLSRLEPVPDSPYSPRLITLDLARGRWRINGTTYQPDATPIVVKRDTVEAWDIRNVAPTMPHPMHVHGFLFRVVSREDSPDQQRRLAVAPGRLAATDLGWKDTVLVWPGETVRIVTDFTHNFPGDQVYMFHCHNLEHADGDMMVNLRVTS